MAIAALLDDETLDLPWPKPALRLIEGGLHGPSAREMPLTWSNESFSPNEEPVSLTFAGPFEAPSTGAGLDVALRRRSRSRARIRRRRLLGAAALVALILALAAPISGLAGRPASGSAVATSGASRPVAAVFVVRSGD